MNPKWPMVPLSEVLQLSIDAVPIDPSQSYPIAGVYSFGRGLFKREPLSGSNTTYRVFHRLHENDFVISQPKAWEGAVARVTSEVDGWFLSPVFPTFRAIPESLEMKYLEWYCRQPKIWEEIRRLCRGMGARRESIGPKQFLDLNIPLPPLPEQRRIVAKIEQLAGKIEEAKALGKQSMNEVDFFLNSEMRHIFSGLSGSQMVLLEDVCVEVIDCLHSNPIYSDDGIPTLRSPDIGWGTIMLEGAKNTSEEEYKRRTQRGDLLPGDIILVREGGGTGRAGIVQEGQKMSLGQRVMQLRPNAEIVNPEFLLYQWLAPIIQEDQIVPKIKGSASPHLNIGALKKFHFLLPPMDEQTRIVNHIDAVLRSKEALLKMQNKIETMLDAFLPATLDRAFRGELVAGEGSA